jgi:hypothetical protein
MKPNLIVVAVLLVLLSGCHSAEVVLFDGAEYPPAESVAIFSDLTTIPWQYIEIGYVEAKGGKTVSKQTLLEDMKTSARKVGANALIKIEFYDRESEGYLKPTAKAVMVRYRVGPDRQFIPIQGDTH